MTGALRNPVYRFLFASQLMSLLGTGLVTVTLAIIAYQMVEERAGLILGTILAIKMIAYVGFAPVANAIVEKVDVRPLLVILDGLRVCLVLLFPFVDSLWQIYGLVLVFQMSSATYTPAYQSTIPEVLTDERDYSEALSLSRLAYNLENMASPLLAGLLLALVAPQSLFFIAASAFLCAGLFVFLADLPRRSGKGSQSTFKDRLTKGFMIFRHTPRLRGLFIANFALSFSVAWVLVNSVVYAQSSLEIGARGYALLMAAFGFGSIVGALAVPYLLDRFAVRSVILSGSFALGILPFAVLAPLSFGSSATLWAVLGLAASLVLTPGGLIITRSATKPNRPPLFAAQFSLSHSGWLLTYPLAGWLGTVMPISAAFCLMAGLSLLLTLVAVRLWPFHDPAEIPHTHMSFEHTHPFIDDEHHRGLGPAPANRESWTHRHGELKHSHVYYIDDHHPAWASDLGKARMR